MRLLAGQGLLPGSPLHWPANVSFMQILDELRLVPGERTPYAVDIRAGDGMRLDIYKRPINPIYPLYRKGYAGLSIEPNLRYNGIAEPEDAQQPSVTAHSSGSLLTALASANSSGGVRIAWVEPAPQTIAHVLHHHGVPIDLEALHLDDDAPIPLLDAILAAHYSPKVIAVRFNADLPPPLRWSSNGRDTFRHDVEAEKAGLLGASADALFSLLASRYSLISFQLGRWSRWCQRCDERMWFVRSDLLGLRPPRSLLSWRQMLRAFWAHVLASNVAPRAQPGKLLSHSADRIGFEARKQEQEAATVSTLAWNGTQLMASAVVAFPGPVRPFGRPPADEPAEVQQLRGWCIRAERCPLHVFSHAPKAAVPAMQHDVTGEPRLVGVDWPWPLPGSVGVETEAHAKYALASEKGGEPAMSHAVCAYALDWARRTREQVCERSRGCKGPEEVGPFALAIAQSKDADDEQPASFTCGASIR